jgi:hypothetical protein
VAEPAFPAEHSNRGNTQLTGGLDREGTLVVHSGASLTRRRSLSMSSIDTCYPDRKCHEAIRVNGNHCLAALSAPSLVSHAMKLTATLTATQSDTWLSGSTYQNTHYLANQGEERDEGLETRSVGAPKNVS